MNAEPIRVAIVAPVHNRKAITLQCLRSLARINSVGLAIHIVIVDDGSTDGTSDAIRGEFPDVEIVAGDGNLWFTEGTNVGVRAALKHEPRYILMINDDAVFDMDFLRYMVDTAEKYRRSIIGSLLLLWDTPHKLFQTSPVWDTWRGGWCHWHSQTIWTVPAAPWKVDLIVGNCLLVPATALSEAGLMNSRRFPNFGDAEFTPRLKRLGWTLIIDPRARVFCQPNTPPPRLKNMKLSELFSVLIADLGNPHNVRRRFFACYEGAPSKLQGCAAFVVFLIDAVFGTSHEKGKLSSDRKEEPLTKTFASAVVDE